MADSPLIQAFAFQRDWCRGPSPFTSRLLGRTLAWLQTQPLAHDTLAALTPDPLAGAVALRWAGALHHLALQGLSPWAGLWPPAAAEPSDAALDDAIARAWSEQQPALAQALAGPPQTNEVQRSAALLPGLLHIAASTGLPLALLEIGASAGLNLWPERHRYDFGGWAWGDPAAALVLRSAWRGPLPALADTRLQIVSRAACDAQPIDLTRPGEALRLASFIWPDQAERLQRLRAAMAVTTPWLAQEGVQVQALRAADFVAQQLQTPRPGVATVLLHSVVWQYIDPAEQAAISACLQAAAASASAQAPLAWLRLEPPTADGAVDLRCTLWPGGHEQVLATAHPHGTWIGWRDTAPAAGTA